MLDIFFITFITCVVVVLYVTYKILSLQNKRKIENVLKEFGDINFHIAEVKFSRARLNILKVNYPGITIDATLYISESIIFICSKNILYLELPLILFKNLNRRISLPNSISVINPSKIYVTSWNAIKIEYGQLPLYYVITIDLYNKTDNLLLSDIKNWYD